MHRLAVMMGVPVALLGWAIGCNAISGVDELQEVGATTRPDKADAQVDAEATTDGYVHSSDAHAAQDVAASILDASEAAILEAGLGVCNELTLLLRVDGTMTSAQGQAPQGATAPNPSFSAGKFGQAVVFTNSNAPYLGYDAVSGGKTITSSSVGTAMMWIKPNGGWSPGCGNDTASNPGWSFFGVDSNGVYGDCEKGGLGVWVDLDPSGTTYVGTSLGPSATWQTNGFNHLAFTWSSVAGTLSITLNGSTSQTATQAWTPPDPTAAVFYLGDNSHSKSIYDDVAVWTRVLSPTEIAAVYGSGKSLGEMCGLP